MKKNDTNSPFSPDFLPIVDGVMVYEKMYFFTDQALSRSASKVKSAVCCVFLSVALHTSPWCLQRPPTTETFFITNILSFLAAAKV